MKSKKTIYLIWFMIVCLVAFMFVATYAYFTLEITGTGNKNEINSIFGNLEITFTDTSNVSLVNAYTGDSITKTFTVENTGDLPLFYDIYFKEVVNNFADPEDLVYSISSTNNGAYSTGTMVPTTNDNRIARAVSIAPGIVHSYTMTITFLRTDDDQSDNANKTFSAKISASPTVDVVAGGRIFKNNSLGYALLNNNTVLSSSGIDFSANATDGLYYTNTSIDSTTVYYFRGSNALNNNLIFAGKCWKIIRTTEDYGIRIIYNGTPTDNKCESVGSAVIDSSSFNDNNNYNAYVGYMFGSASSSGYLDEHANNNASMVKDKLDSWYGSNISTYASYVADSYYCNDRKTSSFTLNSVIYGKDGYGNHNTGYLSRNNLINNKPSYNCFNKLDIFTVQNDRGNASLNNPIGLITSAEAMYAGLNLSTDSSSNYLYSGNDYWTMSPAYFNGSRAYNSYITSGGKISDGVVSTSYGIRPVITLKQDTILIGGNGSAASPYKIN